MAAAIVSGSELLHYGTKSLKRFKEDGQKLLIANRHLVGLMALHKPEAMVLLKPSPKKATAFNLQLIAHIKGLAESHKCPLFSLGIKQVRTVLGGEGCLKNQRQLAELLARRFPELGRCLPANPTRLVSDREKYYQPLFASIGLALAYLKLISKANE